MSRSTRSLVSLTFLGLALAGCSETDDESGLTDSDGLSGDGDGDGDGAGDGDGDGDGSGDGDGDGDGSGDGDGDGDGDGAGDGDGDGDGDGAGDGDGDGDGGGDGDGDGDGDGVPDECGLEGLVDPGPVAATPGQAVHHFTDMSHTGEEINICSFAGKEMMIDLSAVWCGPCNMAADCIAGSDASCGQLFQGGLTPQIQEMVTAIRTRLQNDETNWVTVLYQNDQGGPTNLGDLQSWAQQYPQDNVWVLADGANASASWLPTNGIPYFVSVTTSFTYSHVNDGYEWGDLAQ